MSAASNQGGGPSEESSMFFFDTLCEDDLESIARDWLDDGLISHSDLMKLSLWHSALGGVAKGAIFDARQTDLCDK